MAGCIQGHGPAVFLVEEEDAGLVVAGIAGRHFAIEEGGGVERFAVGFAVIMGTVTIGEETQSVHDRQIFWSGVAITGEEPADGAGAASGEYDPFVIRFPQDGIDALCFPDGDHVQGIAAAYDDRVHAHQFFFEGLLFRGAVDPHTQDIGFDGKVMAEVVPAINAIRIIGGGGGQEADPGSAFAGEGDHLFDKGFLRCATIGQDLSNGCISRRGAGLGQGR